MRVVVIGGGIVGTAAAYRLAEAGMTVTLLERGAAGRARAGARARKAGASSAAGGPPC